jgi:hypothetical protein
MRKLVSCGVALLVGVGLAVAGASPAAAYYEGRYVFGGAADYDGDGHLDLIGKPYAGDLLYLFPGSGGRGPITETRVQIGNGWTDWTVEGVADWDADGHQDLIARDPAANLWIYPGQSVRGYSTETPVQIGNGWGGYDIVGIVDWDNDGHQDFVVRQYATGVLWLFPGQSARGYGYNSLVRLGTGWTSDWWVAGVADYDRDGSQDVVTKHTPSGDLYLCPGNARRGPMTDACVKIGNGWQEWGFAGVADWDADGHADLIARSPANGQYSNSPRDLWLYPGQSVRGYSTEPRTLLGTDW